MRIFSLHIPKTAGTSFHRILLKEFDGVTPALKRKDVIGFLEDKSFGSFCEGYKVIHGHFKFREVSSILEPNDKLISWVRNPTDRVISNYFFFMEGLRDPNRNPTQYSLNKHRRNETLLEYASKPENRNRMSDWLAGSDIDDYYFLGVFENISEELERLGGLLGVELDNGTWLNKGLSKGKVSKNEYEQVSNLNQGDWDLYNRIVEGSSKGLL